MCFGSRITTSPTREVCRGKNGEIARSGVPPLAFQVFFVMRSRGLGVLLLCLRLVASFYLPGLSPVEYELGALVEMKVNKLTSVKTQLPYDYYTLPFCRPRVITTSAENLGEILEDDRIENSPYEIRMLEDMTCKVVCKQTLTIEMRKQFENMIRDEYLVN